MEVARLSLARTAALSLLLEVISDVVSDASSQLGFLTVVPQFHLSRVRTRRRSLSHTEKVFRGGPMARSALVVLTANPNTRSLQAAATVITTMTELRSGVEKEELSWQKTSTPRT